MCLYLHIKYMKKPDLVLAPADTEGGPPRPSSPSQAGPAQKSHLANTEP